MPQLLSVGPSLDVAPVMLERPLPHASLDAAVPIGLIAEGASGFAGRPGIEGSRPDGSAWSPRFVSQGVDVDAGGRRATFRLHDPLAQLELELRLTVDAVLTIGATLTNRGDDDYGLVRLAPSVVLPATCGEALTFAGRWCREFQPQRATIDGTIVVENRTGRTSHATVPAVFAGSAGFGEQHGEVLGVQLAWSGNYSITLERTIDGRRHVQAGELLAPGEVTLASGESYVAPDVVVAWSKSGLSAASRAFHAHVRERATATRPRPVILNTWEAVYFDHRVDTLQRLADVAAQVGVERFVLDDGWFGGRRDDTKGLGDWWVSEAVWPTGLGPIVDHVRGLGMEFGLWVEPEMVNPDSELYRKHPEWTLTTHGYDAVLGRHQLVLDLGRNEVREFLFGAIDALVREYDIAYLKWDMNRDVVQGSHHGRAGVHGHVTGLYRLVDELRAAHPGLEIESCASGGGRADLGILRRTDRIWTSDCNDALERQLIQRGFSMLFPPEVMGAHVGPGRAHTTGRRHGVGFRAATAAFGHLGIEWNLLDATDDELRELAAAIAAHQRLRPVLHRGAVQRLDHPDPSVLAHGVVSDDRGHAVFCLAQIAASSSTVPTPVRLAGLDATAAYRVTVVRELGPSSFGGRSRPSWLDAPVTVAGSHLMALGVQPPILHPETALVIELERVA